MPNVLNILPNAVGQPETNIFVGAVASPAPNTPTAPLFVALEHNETINLQVDSWAPIWGALMPQVGDDVVVILDDHRFVRCVWWGSGAPREVAARAFSATNLTIGPGPTQVTLDTISFDAGENLDLGLGAYVAPFQGIYDVRGQVSVVPAASSGTMQFYVSIYVNGVERSRGERHDDVDVVGSQVSGVVGDLVACSAGDLITLWTYTSAATTLAGGQGGISGSVGVDGLAGLTNYMAVTHASYW